MQYASNIARRHCIASCQQTLSGRGATPARLDRPRETSRSPHSIRRTRQAFGRWAKRPICVHNPDHLSEMGEPETGTRAKTNDGTGQVTDCGGRRVKSLVGNFQGQPIEERRPVTAGGLSQRHSTTRRYGL